MKAINKYNNVEMRGEMIVVQSGMGELSIDNLITGGKLGNNLAQSTFTKVIESDPGIKALLSTEASKMLKAMRDASMAGDVVPIYGEDKDGNLTLKNIPTLSFSPMTATADSCCVVAGDLQVCQDDTILKPLCLEKCDTELNRMVAEVSRAGADSAVYAAYKAMLNSAGIAKSAMPTLEEFEQLSLIGQFIVLNILTFLNGLLSVEQNGNIVKRFSGLAQVYARPDVIVIPGTTGILDIFEQVQCRMNALGFSYFGGGFFLADRIAYSAIQKAVVPKRDGQYPSGWTVKETTVNVKGTEMPSQKYYFNGIEIIESDLLYVDDENFTGDIYFVPPTVGVFSAVPLDMPAPFLLNEWNKARSNFVHWDKTANAYPTCWTDCTRLTNFGAVVSTEVNALIKITGIDSGCDAEAFKGVEGLININSYAPYIA